MYHVILITNGGLPFATRKTLYTGTKSQCGIYRDAVEPTLKGNQMLLTERATQEKKNAATADRLFKAIAKVDAAGNRSELKRYIGSPEWKRHHGYDQPKPKKDERKATWAFIAKHCLK